MLRAILYSVALADPLADLQERHQESCQRIEKYVPKAYQQQALDKEGRKYIVLEHMLKDNSIAVLHIIARYDETEKDIKAHVPAGEPQDAALNGLYEGFIREVEAYNHVYDQFDFDRVNVTMVAAGKAKLKLRELTQPLPDALAEGNKVAAHADADAKVQNKGDEGKEAADELQAEGQEEKNEVQKKEGELQAEGQKKLEELHAKAQEVLKKLRAKAQEVLDKWLEKSKQFVEQTIADTNERASVMQDVQREFNIQQLQFDGQQTQFLAQAAPVTRNSEEGTSSFFALSLLLSGLLLGSIVSAVATKKLLTQQREFDGVDSHYFLGGEPACHI